MIYGEKPQTRKLHQDGKGLTGTMVFLCDWADVDPAPIIELPHYGAAWPGLPQLTVVDVDASESDAGLCLYTVQFSTERALAEEWCDESIEISLEQADDDEGWDWEDAGTPVTDPMQKSRPLMVYSLNMKRGIPPITEWWDNLYKVNDRVFRGVPAGCLRFDGASADNRYDLDGNIISSSCVYKFTARKKPWIYRWRKALQARDTDGKPIFWHNIDENMPYYTTDPTKIATPVWINQITGQEGNVAGIADWDKPKKDGNYYYESADLATVLNLPRKEGDGE